MKSTNPNCGFREDWDFEDIEIIHKEENLNNREFLRLRWACNAKPDVMIISRKHGLFIELKVESGIGTNKFGYNQEETQSDILELLPLTVPCFSDMDFRKIILSKGEKSNITWSEIKDKLTNELALKHLKNMPK